MPTGGWLHSYLFIWFMVVLQCGVIIMLVRQVSALLGHWVRNDPDWGLPLGSTAPELPAIDIFGNPIPSVCATKTKRALFFVSASCKACNDLMLRVPPTARLEGVEVVVIVQASTDKTRLFLAKHGLGGNNNVRVVCDAKGTLSASYKVAVVPYIVVVNTEGRIGAKRGVITLTEIGMLLARADRKPDVATANRAFVKV